MKKELKDYVTTIPDFPQKGIMFRDITSVIDDADGLQLAINSMQDLVKDIDFDVVVGAESRGFVFGTPIAYNLHKPMVLIRKKGKLPRETVGSGRRSCPHGTQGPQGTRRTGSGSGLLCNQLRRQLIGI